MSLVSNERPLRVIHVPSNIASIPSHTVRGLRDLGIDARAIEFNFEPSPFSTAAGVEFVRRPYSRLSPHWPRYVHAFAHAIAWADVVHWYYDTRVLPRDWDLRLVRMFGRPSFVEWMGSEIRSPDVEIGDNPVFASVWEEKKSLTPSSATHSRAAQLRFDAFGFVPLAHPGMRQYLLPELSGKAIGVDRALQVSDYIPSYPEPGALEPVLVHAPSARSLKGSEYVDLAVSELGRRHVALRFELVHGVTRSEALERIAACDIFLDQFIVGDFGMASLEAMALGKPVVCYVKESLRGAYPADLPIVSATPDELPDVLEWLLRDGSARARLGREGRSYVEQHHSMLARASALQSTYMRGMEKSQRRRR